MLTRHVKSFIANIFSIHNFGLYNFHSKLQAIFCEADITDRK